MEWKTRLIGPLGTELELDIAYSSQDLHFTDEEKNKLRQVLSAYNSERVDRFIKNLRRACEDYRFYLDQNNQAKSWQEIEDILPTLKKALKILKVLQSGAPIRSIQAVPGVCKRAGERKSYFLNESLMTKAFWDCPTLAYQARKELSPLVAILEEIQPPRPGKGRPNFEGGFAQAISDIFTDTFKEKPSKWREGALSQVLQICLEGVELKSEDPDRRLKSIRPK